MKLTGNTIVIGIIPNVQGLGGPASFNNKLATILEKRGVRVTYDLRDPELSAVLVIGGSRHLEQLRQVKQRGIRIVQRLNGMNWIHRKQFHGVRHYFRSEVNNWLLQTIRSRFADHIVYQSVFSRDWWERIYGKVNRSCGVDLAVYHPATGKAERSGELRVVVVEGNIKNGSELALANVLDALELYRKRSAEKPQVTIVGAVAEPVRLKLQQDRQILLNWAGVLNASAIIRLEQEQDLFFSAEVNPACPNSVIEALACGLPVAGFDSGALHELVDAESGMIVPYGTDIWKLQPAIPEPMVEAIIKQRQRLPVMGRNARQRAEALYGLDAMADAYMDALTG